MRGRRKGGRGKGGRGGRKGRLSLFSHRAWSLSAERPWCADRPALQNMYNAVYEAAGVDVIVTPMTSVPATPISATEPYTYYQGKLSILCAAVGGSVCSCPLHCPPVHCAFTERRMVLHARHDAEQPLPPASRLVSATTALACRHILPRGRLFGKPTAAACDGRH